MRNVWIFAGLFLAACRINVQKEQSQEQPEVKQQTAELPAPDCLPPDIQTALLGTWEYQFSKHQGERIPIHEMRDLSAFYTFERGDEASIQKHFPRLYAFAKNKILFPTLSTHEDYRYGPQSFPLVNTISKDSTRARITHYVLGNGVGKMSTHFLTRLDSDTLILEKQRSYPKNGADVTGVKHYYQKVSDP